MKIFLSCSMTAHMEKGEEAYLEQREFIGQIANMLRDLDCEVYNPFDQAQVQQQEFDDFPPVKVFEENRNGVFDCDFVVSIWDEFSGQGQASEATMAYFYEKPVFLYLKKGVKLSQMNSWNPLVTVITLDEYEWFPELIAECVFTDIQELGGY